MFKYDIGLRLFLQESLYSPKFYGNLFYKFRKIFG